MENSLNRKSIFRILIIRIFLLLVLFNIIVSYYIIRDEIRTEKRYNEEKSRDLISEVKSILNFMGSNIENLEIYYHNQQNIMVKEFEEILTELNVNNIPVNKIIHELNYDTSLHQIRIIKDGIIINSNNNNEIGSNIFAELNASDSTYFKDKIMKGSVFKSKFVYQKENRRFGVIAFYPVNKNFYVIGISTGSPEFDKMIELFKLRLQEIKKSNPSILAMNFWFQIEDKRIPMLADSLNMVILANIKGPVATQDSVFMKLKWKGRYLGIDHIYEKSRHKIYNFKGMSISIITDYTDQSQPIKKIVRNRLILMFFYLLLFFLLVHFATKNLKLTLADLLKRTSEIGSGELHKRVKVVGNNEFTTLAEQFNKMVENVESAHNELKNKNKEISAQRDENSTQRDEIELLMNLVIEHNNIIEIQKTNILDSIKYAQKIQEAVLPDKEYILQILPQSFIYYKPRNIVSGDFYWINEIDMDLVIVAADCTGHGVPGAIMSMLGASLLNEIILGEKIIQPNLILKELRDKIKYLLKQTGKEDEAKDGMDISICTINRLKMEMQYAGAMNPLILIRHNKVIEYEGDYMPVGVSIGETVNFTNHELTIEENDTYYMFSDGYADQFGGQKNRKFMLQNFLNLLLEISTQPMSKQLEILNNSFLEWKKDTKQIDDVLVIGFKV